MKQEKIEVSEEQCRPILKDLLALYEKYHKCDQEKESTIVFVAALRITTLKLEEVLFGKSGFVFGKIETETK